MARAIARTHAPLVASVSTASPMALRSGAEPLAKARVEAELDGESTWVDTAKAQPKVNGTAPAIPEQFIVHIHGKDFVQYAGLLAMAHERGLLGLEAKFISVTSELALAEATVDFKDGSSFSECADSTPSNVGSKIAPHFARMSLTRAKARCLRDALNISVCSVEEL